MLCLTLWAWEHAVDLYSELWVTGVSWRLSQTSLGEGTVTPWIHRVQHRFRLYYISVATTGFLWVVGFHPSVSISRYFASVGQETWRRSPKLFILTTGQWVLNMVQKPKSQYEMHSTWMAAAVGVFVWTTYCRPAPGSCGAACMDSASLPSSATHSQSVSSAQTGRTPTAALNRSTAYL